MNKSERQSVVIADFDAIQVGDTAELVRLLSSDDVASFARLSGDTNPLHLDESFGAQTTFHGTVVHGMLGASLISQMIGTKLPGAGALWLSQTLDFVSPIRPGDTLRVVTTVTAKHGLQRVLDLHTVIFNQRNMKVIEGKSRVRMMSQASTVEEKQTGTVALVTGASRGIGAAIARALAAQGLKVAVNYRTNEAEAGAVISAIKTAGGEALAVRADVSDEKDVEALFQHIAEALGPVDVLVNNAWPRISLRPFTELNWTDFERHLNTGLKAAVNLCRIALPSMIEQKFGRIINIGSISAEGVPPLQQADYVVAKSALAAFTRCLAVEFGPKGITANTIAPGMTDTVFISDMPQKARLLAEVQAPLRRIAEPEDVADVVAFLASPAARHMTGETLRVCGGQVM